VESVLASVEAVREMEVLSQHYVFELSRLVFVGAEEFGVDLVCYKEVY
jgi:hypothetical protein